ncbi:MAG TPA: DUF3999 family protein [Acidobacteriaceae bacterium]|jgi:hypothetical protein
MLRIGVAVLALAAAAPVIRPAFHYERPVQLATANVPETCVVLSPDLLAHAAPMLEDLRVMAGGREVAYQVRTSNDVAEDVGRPEQILNLGERNGAISFDAEMSEPRYSRVLLKMARSHFSVLIHVTGVDRPGEAGLTFPEIPYSSDTPEDEPQVKRITLPESTFRYLHFEIQTLALAPLTPQDIAGVDVLTESTEPPRYMQVVQANAPQQKPRVTVYEFAVPANAPVERLTFASDDPNAVFSRAASLERWKPGAASGEGTRGPETAVQSEGITLAHAPPAKGEAASSSHTIDLDLGAVPYASTVRLTIQNGDDAPLVLHGITLEMRERQACFLRKANASYVLRYGDPALGAPQYDLSPIEAATANASVSTLGEERALAPGAAAERPFTERHPVLLWVALILVVGTLGVVALRSAGKGSGIRD